MDRREQASGEVREEGSGRGKEMEGAMEENFKMVIMEILSRSAIYCISYYWMCR